MKTLILAASLFLVSTCNQAQSETEKTQSEKTMDAMGARVPGEYEVLSVEEYLEGRDYTEYKVATFAGGCFWCTEAQFERIMGVHDVVSGHTGGEIKYPTYKEVGTGKTGHAESVFIWYDPEVITYEQLLEVFFVGHDPTTPNRQGPDIGPQYRSAIFYHNEEQKATAQSYIEELNKQGTFYKPIVTELNAYEQFWLAEGYHQNFYELHPYQSYVANVSRPKVKKVEKTFKNWLKPEYQ